MPCRGAGFPPRGETRVLVGVEWPAAAAKVIRNPRSTASEFTCRCGSGEAVEVKGAQLITTLQKTLDEVSMGVHWWRGSFSRQDLGSLWATNFGRRHPSMLVPSFQLGSSWR